MLINRRKALGHVYQGPAMAIAAALTGAGGLAQHEAQRKARHKQEDAAKQARQDAARSAAQSATESAQAVQRDAAVTAANAEAERIQRESAQEDTTPEVTAGDEAQESRRKKRQRFSVGGDDLQSVSI